MNFTTLLDLMIALGILGAQIRFFLQTRAAAARLEDLFPLERPIAMLRVAAPPAPDGAELPASGQAIHLQAAGPVSNGFESMLEAANRYLDRTRGMPVTFLVLQDIVERNAEVYEQTPSATVTLPLYVGLMGTFLGVIVGLISLAGSKASSAEDADLSRFLSGILVAMTGSLVGLVLFVAGKRLLSRAQTFAGAGKRDFYIFLQSELVPAAGQEVSTALYSLQANLLTFNQEFRSNLQLFGNAMEAPARTVQEQRELLQALQATDLKRIVEANAGMLKSLKAAAPTLESFLEASQRFVMDLESVRDLTGRVGALLDRVASFEHNVNVLGERLSSDAFASDHVLRLIGAQLDALENRKKLIVQFTDVQDATIRESLRAQETKVGELLTAAQQSIATAGEEMTRTVASVMGGDKTSDLFANVALLKEIAQRTQAAQRSLAVIEGSANQNARVVQLLERISASLVALDERPSFGHLLHRFLPGSKGGPASHAE